MASISIEELRIRAALANPGMSSAEVRAEAERVIATLDAIEAADAMRAAIEAQQAEHDRQESAEAQRRDEAFGDARAIVRKSHPGWDDGSVEMEAHRLAAENERAVAELNLREALTE